MEGKDQLGLTGKTGTKAMIAVAEDFVVTKVRWDMRSEKMMCSRSLEETEVKDTGR